MGFISRRGERQVRLSRAYEPGRRESLFPTTTRRRGPTNHSSGEDLRALLPDTTLTRRRGLTNHSSGEDLRALLPDSADTQAETSDHTPETRYTYTTERAYVPSAWRRQPPYPLRHNATRHTFSGSRPATIVVASVQETTRVEPAPQSFLEYLLSYPLPGDPGWDSD